MHQSIFFHSNTLLIYELGHENSNSLCIIVKSSSFSGLPSSYFLTSEQLVLLLFILCDTDDAAEEQTIPYWNALKYVFALICAVHQESYQVFTNFHSMICNYLSSLFRKLNMLFSSWDLVVHMLQFLWSTMNLCVISYWKHALL